MENYHLIFDNPFEEQLDLTPTALELRVQYRERSDRMSHSTTRSCESRGKLSYIRSLRSRYC